MKMLIGNDIIFLEEVDSTNRYLSDWLSKEKVKEGTLVWAFCQTAGRGLDNNSWESIPGRNLTFSFVLYPSFLAANRQFYITKAISLALVDLIRNELPGNYEVKIKWPNDIYIGNRKVAGVLIQNGVKGEQFEYSIIGIGLNVNQESFSPDLPNPGSLKQCGGKEFNLEILLRKTIDSIQSRVNILLQGNHDRLDLDYLADLYRYQQLNDYLFKGEKIQARITGVNRYGQLILGIPGGKTIECDLKDVRFI